MCHVDPAILLVHVGHRLDGLSRHRALTPVVFSHRRPPEHADLFAVAHFSISSSLLQLLQLASVANKAHITYELRAGQVRVSCVLYSGAMSDEYRTVATSQRLGPNGRVLHEDTLEIDGGAIAVHLDWDPASRGPARVEVEVTNDADAEQIARGVNASVMQRVSRAVVARAAERSGDSLTHAREIAARLPAPKVDRSGYFVTLLELHSELSNLGRSQTINDIRDLVYETQAWLIPKGTLRTHLYQAREARKAQTP